MKMKLKNNSGQAMVLTTVILGGLMLVATSVAGLLMFYQLKQASESASSAAAIFAADAGLEVDLDCYFRSLEIPPVPVPGQSYCSREVTYENGARSNSSLSFSFNASTPPQIIGFTVTSYGFSGQAVRVLENSFSTLK
ncbi:MAG: hypothetical protein ABSE68_03025 [Minisyncoccia bacterium]